ncbi:stAR-related lipid transfer 7, mitochondrial-like isoform X1 [Olea europaea subsp. europaea]|uniref:StAR-related lipid transfer 7, mitochondrial-like isoform X1 n=1 Tax=Olea europaea subsp. europaea TaxID=158383 RepID=A0A8S0TV55_OLEEU|nr:stAR-related lipid transfer 7, mitochondrial-like isoform X1 [Olea europaea subsp. europaea]
MTLVEAFLDIFERPTLGAIIIGMTQFLGPVWIAFFLGIMVGWVWKPGWANLGKHKFDFSAPSSLSSLITSPVQGLGSTQILDTLVLDDRLENKHVEFPGVYNVVSSYSEIRKEENVVVMNDDLVHLCHLVERKDGGTHWKHMMNLSTHNMSYQAWQRDPEYYNRSVYEDATPELLRDFFWDDEFRMKWDNTLIHVAIIEECPTTGMMMVHLIRKVRKPEPTVMRAHIFLIALGVPYPSVPRKDKPRRVDLYYSSWYIQAVESRKRDVELSACKVILFHHEDMGIPWEIARFGVPQGMWGAVRNIDHGFRAYQKAKAYGAPISHPMFMAQISTRIDLDYLKIMEGEKESPESQILDSPRKPKCVVNIPKLLIIGGASVIGCSLDRGLLTKPLIFGLARTFGNIGKRTCPRTS